MKRVLICLFFLYGCIAQGFIRQDAYSLTDNVLTSIARVERENLEESAQIIEQIITQYKINLDALMYRGLDINARGYLDQTALMRASEEGNSDIVALLLGHKADVTCTDQEGFTALMHFVSQWIIQEGQVASIRTNTVKRAYQNPKRCMQLLQNAGAESLEFALLSVEHVRVRRAEDVQAKQYEGLRRLVAHVALKLNPKTLLEKTKRRIKMRRLRSIQ